VACWLDPIVVAVAMVAIAGGIIAVFEVDRDMEARAEELRRLHQRRTLGGPDWRQLSSPTLRVISRRYDAP
jgi:hypothetical protein